MISERPLEGRVTMVTGASGGIGRAITRRLAEAGCHVGLTWATRREAAERDAANARDLGVRSRSISARFGSWSPTPGSAIRCGS